MKYFRTVFFFFFCSPLLVGKIKNILLIVSDDLKADALSCYGNPIAKTPNLDRLAKEGMLFKHAYCQGTVCAPSRSSLMRGRYFGKNEITWGEHFQNNGLSSTRVGKIFHMRVPGDIIDGTDGADVPRCWSEKFNMPGLEAHTPGNYACLNLNIFTHELQGRESTRMPNRMFVTVDYSGDGSDQPDWKAATKSIEILTRFASEKNPFFLATGLIRPHYPNVAPRQYFKEYPLSEISLPVVPDNDWSDIPKLGLSHSNSKSFGIDQYPENQKRMWAGYLATVTFMDEQVGRILKALKELGLDQETAIFFTSDHGYLLGEHHFWQKGNLREEVTRVPLIIKAPGFKPGQTKSIVELVDLLPTACSMLNLNMPSSVQGKCILPILNNPKEQSSKPALSFVPNRKGTSMRTPKWSYMKYKDGSEELYDMIRDPLQFSNLVESSNHHEDLSKLRQRFRSQMKRIQ